MSVVVVVGTRPEIIKMAPVIKEFGRMEQNSYLFTPVNTTITR